MNNSAHIFKELNLLMPELCKRYKPKDIFYIGLRLNDKQVPKVEVFFEELVPVLFHIIDTNDRKDIQNDKLHPIWVQKEYSGKLLVSIYVCDTSSQTIYDSMYYQQNNAKYILQKDKDPRISQFKRLTGDDKEQIIDLTVAQIIQMQQDLAEGTEPDDTGTENTWGEMPWDFQE